MDDNLAKTVAVIIPAIREDKHLLQAVESVYAQTYAHTLPVVVKDGQFESLWLDQQSRDGRLRLVQLPVRRGTPIALNAGIAAVPEVDYIARLDADDLSHADRIWSQVDCLESCDRSTAMAVTSTNLIDHHGSIIGSLPVDERLDRPRARLLLNNWIVHSTIMLRADVLRAIGGYNPRCLRMQDYELYLRFALDYDFAILPEPLVSYRLHDNQSSRKAKPWGVYIHEVIKARTTLAKVLGKSTPRQHLWNFVWVGVQWLRWMGLRKPGFDRVADRRVR